uniref:Uncharacterized protein n=1 Tax=Solanum lycopersicum TaxID=4081 RepID=A0A3Q7HSS3_SOLLC
KRKHARIGQSHTSHFLSIQQHKSERWTFVQSYHQYSHHLPLLDQLAHTRLLKNANYF